MWLFIVEINSSLIRVIKRFSMTIRRENNNNNNRAKYSSRFHNDTMFNDDEGDYDKMIRISSHKRSEQWQIGFDASG